MKTEHILIIRFSSMGDVAMVVPIVHCLARQYPNVRITMLSKPFAKPLFENIAPNVSFMSADINNKYKGVKGLNKLYKRLAAKQFTAVADLHNVLRSNYLRIMFHLNRYNVAHINKHRAGRKMLTAINNKILEQQPTAFQNYADVFSELGYPIDLNFTSIFPQTGGNIELLYKKIPQKQANEQWIGIAPFAAHEGKIYPLHKMEQVISILTKANPTIKIFLFGAGEEEYNILNEFVSRNNACLNASEALNGLGEELILISHLKLMVSMDSCNMHLASLVNTPVVSIWGATHSYAGFMGYNQKEANAVQIYLPCRPCSIFGNKPCMRGDYACLNNIDPQVVVKKIEALLQTK